MRSPSFVVPSFALALALALAACASSEGGDVRARIETNEGTLPRIIGGTPSTAAQDSTVFITLTEGFCTGSLIAPNLVLTARHCVSQMAGNDDCQHFTTDDPPASMRVVLGAMASKPSLASPAVAHGIKVFHETNNSGCGYDIALIQLDHDIAGASIANVRFTKATTSDIGTAVGYGDGDDHGHMTNGRYQRGNIAVIAVGPANATYKKKNGATMSVSVDPGEILTGESTCYGDSGGPLFDSSGNIIGVTSRGIDGYCVDRPSVWSDVYSHLTMIQNAAMVAGHPLAASGTADAGASSSSGGTGSSGTSGTSGSSSGSHGSSGASSSGSAGTGGTAGSGAAHAAPPPATPAAPAEPMTSTTTESGCATAGLRRDASGGGGGVVAVLALVAGLAGRRRRGRGRS